MDMKNVVHVQTIMLEEDLNTLKILTGKDTTKDALITAIEYYLENYQ